MQTNRRNLLKGALATSALASLSLASATPALAYSPNPTNGTKGTFNNQNNLSYTDAQGISSQYHLRAAHVTGPGPYPLVIHLHGDGGYEFKNPDVWTSAQYLDVARSINAPFIIPRTPQTSSGYTWWRSYSSSQWLANFINWEYRWYNIDRNRIFISGYSGGAQILSYNLVADFNYLFTGGGAMMLGGGGTSGMYISRTPSASTKSNFLMRWHVGQDDDGSTSSDGFDALQASQIGYNTYNNAGWNARRTIIPNEDHYESEDNGPSALRSLVNESNSRYGLPLI